MGEPDSHAQLKEHPPCPALMTPSLSPPSSRILESTLTRLADRVPPTKRSRLASTPSSALSRPESSSATPDIVTHIHESRVASSRRLLDVWAQLERYNRPLDKDDIIDLRDGSLVKDRGVLRGSPRRYEVGFFAGDDVPSDVLDTSSDGYGVPTEGEDDDVDELDAFSHEANLSDELKWEKEKLKIPRPQAVNPADAEDLRDFLEAERQRKELCGDLEDDDDDEEEEILHAQSTVRDSLEHSDHAGTIEGGKVRSGPQIEVDDKKNGADEPPCARTRAAAAPPRDDSSDDEFATWDFDCSSPVRQGRTGTVPSEASVTNEIIDLTDSPPSSPPRPPIRRGRSVGPAIFSPQAVTRSRSKSFSRGRSKTPPLRKNSMAPPPVPRDTWLQLMTPPLSSSSGIESTPDISQASEPPLSSLSPTPPPRPKPRPRYKGTQVEPTSGNRKKSQGSVPLFPPADQSPEVNKKPSRRILIPEVVITRRSQSVAPSRTAQKDISWRRAGQDRGKAVNTAQVTTVEPAIIRKNKGKGRAMVPVGSHDSEGKRVGPAVDSTPRTHSERLSPDVEDLPPPPPTRSRKRKRIVSSSPSSERSEKEGSSPNLHLNVPARVHRDRGSGPSSGSRISDIASGRKAASSPLPNADDDSDDDDDDDKRNASRPRSSHISASESTRLPLHPHMSYEPRHDEHHPRYLFPLALSSQEARIAQTVASFLTHAAAGSLVSTSSYPPAYPPPYFMPSPHWPPWTPSRQRRSDHHNLSDMSPSDAGPSGPSSMYSTPTHPHPYPFHFDPTFSSGTLPPSSPVDSSQPSSPAPRSSSLARGRSRSRGRRVSFKLDGNDKPVLLTPPRLSDDEDPQDLEGTSSQSRQKYRSITRDYSQVSGQNKSRSTTRSKVAGKGKGIAAIATSEDFSESDVEIERLEKPVKRHERARTPGPPSQRERSMSVRPGASRKA